MSTISSSAKVGYIYDEATDTWYPVAGLASTSTNYSWTGTHSFGASVTFENVLNAKAGINNFQNPAARNAAIPSPTPGIVVFVRQDENSNTINQIQYYSGSSWVNYNTVKIRTETASYIIGLEDVDKLIKIDSSSNLTVTIPPASSANFPEGSRLEIYRAGTGEVTIVPGASVTIRSKLNNTRISTQYSGAMITKIGTNEWHLIGDLKAAV